MKLKGEEIFFKFLSSKEYPLLNEITWIISNICAGTINQIDILIKAGIMKKIIKLTGHSCIQIKHNITWALGNISAIGNYSQLKILVNYGIIEAFSNLLDENISQILTVALRGIFKLFNCPKISEEFDGLANFKRIFEQCGGLEKIFILKDNRNDSIYKECIVILDEFFIEVEENSIDIW